MDATDVFAVVKFTRQLWGTQNWILALPCAGVSAVSCALT